MKMAVGKYHLSDTYHENSTEVRGNGRWEPQKEATRWYLQHNSGLW